jgi:outer membrane protein assembly factor BamB
MGRSQIAGRLGLIAGALVATMQVARPVAQEREPVLHLSQTVGPPTTVVVVEGAGFGRQVDLYFDADRAGTVQTQGGEFSARLAVPGYATPGIHWIKANGLSSSGSTVGVSTSFKIQTDWAQPGFKANHSGYNPFENVIGAQNVNQLQLAWISPAAPNTFLSSSPAVVDDRLFITWKMLGSAFPSVAAFDVHTGIELWESAIADGGGLSSPAVGNGLVYVATTGSSLYALDPVTGVTNWLAITSFEMKNVGSPVTDGARVYQSTGVCGVDSYGTVQARDALTGSFIWSQYIGCAVGDAAVANGNVYVIGTTSDWSVLYAFKAATGAPLWLAFLPWPASGSPVISGGRVYVNEYHAVQVYDAFTGADLLTAFPLDPYPNYLGLGSPAVAYGRIFVGTATGKMVAMDATSGATVWSSNLPFFSGRVDSSPAVANHVVYVQGSAPNGFPDIIAGFDTDSGVAKFTAYGDANTILAGGSPHPSVAVANGQVFVGTEDGHVMAFKLQ